MPSGKVHDAITLVLVAPTFVAAWGLTGSLQLSVLATIAMLFGGFMFGPDLDIHSRQYSRWGLFRFFWLPYRMVFRHRSRWSHGIVFGTFIRVVYSIAVVAVLIALSVYIYAMATAGAIPGIAELKQTWGLIASTASGYGLTSFSLSVIFAGMWWGAASHTLADVAWSVVRKGSEIF